MESFILILKAIGVLGIIGLIFGILLAVAGKIFAVKKDERIKTIQDFLPGANCGGCGYVGCEQYANAIIEKNEKINLCTVGGENTAKKIKSVLNKDDKNDNNDTKVIRLRAQVMCSGTHDLASKKYRYLGINDCISASRIGGGDKECPYGCLGLGTCVEACPFNAIKVENGVAVVEYEKCHACGVCVNVCPKNIIKLVPYEKNHWVGCISMDKGPVVRSYCDVGCIGCKICTKECPTGAITVEGNIAIINYSKCIDCGKCAEKCPRKIIWSGKEQIEKGDTLAREDIKSKS